MSGYKKQILRVVMYKKVDLEIKYRDRRNEREVVYGTAPLSKTIGVELGGGRGKFPWLSFSLGGELPPPLKNWPS